MDETMDVTPELYMEDLTGSSVTTGIQPGSAADVAVVMGITGLWFAFVFGILIIMIVAHWKIFTKAGEKGWKALIPFYNLWVTLEIAGKPGWWLFIILLIPFVNLIFLFLMYMGLSKAFGKGMGYTLGLFFLAPLFYLMLGFGSATYTKPVEAGDGTSTPPQTPPQDPTPTPQTPPQEPTNQTM